MFFLSRDKDILYCQYSNRLKQLKDVKIELFYSYIHLIIELSVFFS